MAERKDSEFETGIQSLLEKNDLEYNVPKLYSVISRRTLGKHYFNKSSYAPQETMVCVISAGDSYCDGRQSYLQFEVATTGTAVAATWGAGSAINVINRVTLTTASGTELAREEGVNVRQIELDRWLCPKNWVDTNGSVIGYGAPSINDTYCIPLCKLAELFGGDKLLPGMGLMSGLRVEITLESNTPACIWGSDPAASEVPTKYSIVDPVIVMDQYLLSDAVARTLNAQSATSGLSVTYSSWDFTPGSMSTGQQVFNQDTKKAVSKAVKAFCKVRNSAATTAFGSDSMNAQAFDATMYQWVQGNLNFPNLPLTNRREMYQNALYSFDKLLDCHSPGSVASADFTSSRGILTVSLERSSTLDLSGLPVSGSRILQLRSQFATGTADRRADIWMQYVKMVTVFLDRAVLRE